MAVSTGTAILGAAGIGALTGKKGGSTTTTQNSAPWIGQQPYLSDVFERAQGLADRGPFSYAPSAFTSQAQQIQAQRALDPNSAVGRAQGVLGDTISGRYLSPDSNPHLKASVQDALGLAGSAFAGQYGGAAGQNLGNSGYQEALARGLGATATNAYANAYGQERQNQLNAMQLAPTLGMADVAQLGQVGAAQDALAQQQFNSPWENLSKYQAAISGNFGGQGSSQTPYYQNPLATAMGLGIGGLSLYNGMNQAGMFGSAAPSAAPGISMLGSFPTFA
jgi:hypothetical protein